VRVVLLFSQLDEKNEVITDLHSKLRDLNSDYELQKSVADRSTADMARLEVIPTPVPLVSRTSHELLHSDLHNVITVCLV